MATTTGWTPIPEWVCFTDAHMQAQAMLTGSIPGLRLDIWPSGMDLKNTKPIVTRRLGIDDLVSFRLSDFYPGIEPGDLYAVQIHGYLALGSSHMSMQHRKGQGVVHVGHTLVLVSDGWTGTPNPVFRASKLPFLPGGNDAYHLHAIVTCDPALWFYNSMQRRGR